MSRKPAIAMHSIRKGFGCRQTLAKRGTSSQLLKIIDFDFLHPVGDPPGLVLGTDGCARPAGFALEKSVCTVLLVSLH